MKLSDFLGTGYVACVDLEATCCNDNSFPRNEMEIIEFGCTVVDTTTSPYTIVARLDLFVRPVIHTKLTEFCKELTSIHQEDVDSAEPWNIAAEQINEFFHRYCFEVPTVWVSWGDFDANLILREERRRDGGNSDPYPMPSHHFNLKVIDAHARNTTKQSGLGGACNRLQIPFQGTAHRAGDDAAMVAKVLEAMAPHIKSSKV